MQAALSLFLWQASLSLHWKFLLPLCLSMGIADHSFGFSVLLIYLIFLLCVPSFGYWILFIFSELNSDNWRIPLQAPGGYKLPTSSICNSVSQGNSEGHSLSFIIIGISSKSTDTCSVTSARTACCIFIILSYLGLIDKQYVNWPNTWWEWFLFLDTVVSI